MPTVLRAQKRWRKNAVDIYLSHKTLLLTGILNTSFFKALKGFYDSLGYLCMKINLQFQDPPHILLNVAVVKQFLYRTVLGRQPTPHNTNHKHNVQITLDGVVIGHNLAYIVSNATQFGRDRRSAKLIGLIDFDTPY